MTKVLRLSAKPDLFLHLPGKMINEYQKIDLFEKTLLQKISLKPPFTFDFPVADQACFLYVVEGAFQYRNNGDKMDVTTHYSILLNCIEPGKSLQQDGRESACEVVIVTFHPEILKKIYDRELPLVFQKPGNTISAKSGEKLNNDFLIQKYIEGLLFYFENPSLVSDDILILKLKEIVILLSQTQNAETVQVILSQLFSPTAYTFRQLIEAHLFSQLSLEELARECNLSLSSFKREFSKLYHDTPANYIKTKKLERAAELLSVSDQRITEVAFECGFNDLANFTKSFTEKYGMSPTNYRLNRIAK